MLDNRYGCDSVVAFCDCASREIERMAKSSGACIVSFIVIAVAALVDYSNDGHLK